MLKQSYFACQVYLADDGSKDDSLAYVRRKFPKVKILASSKNFGTAGISNWAVKKVREEYVVLASNDMRFGRNCVKELVAGIRAGKNRGICSALLIRDRKDPKTGKYFIDNAGGAMDIFGCPWPLGIEEDWAGYPKEIREVFFSYGGCFIISRKLFEMVGGFDEKFFTLSDDIDLSWRVRLLGKKVVVNPKAFLYHQVSASLGKSHKMAQKRFLSERNVLRMLLKNYQAITLLFIMPFYVLGEIGEILFYLFLGRVDMAGAIVKAVWWNFKMMGNTWTARKLVQKMRVVADLDIMKNMKIGSYKLKLFPLVLKNRNLKR